jgi:hypothetical protein
MASHQQTPSAEELKFHLSMKKWEVVQTVWSTSFPWLCSVAIAAFIWLTARSLAGKMTFAQIGMSLLGDLKISDGVAYMFGAGGVGYGYKERRLRQRTIERLSSRIEDLEKGKDPRRSSSNLTKRGTTRQGDRI